MHKVARTFLLISKLLGLNQGNLDLCQSTADQQVSICSTQSDMITLSFEGDALVAQADLEHCVAGDDFELLIFLSLPPKC